jgi:hypothetical protein
MHGELPAARAAENDSFVELVGWPNGRRVLGEFLVAIEARVPTPAALELDRDDVERGVPMGAARLGVDADAMHLFPVYQHDHFPAEQSIR